SCCFKTTLSAIISLSTDHIISILNQTRSLHRDSQRPPRHRKTVLQRSKFGEHAHQTGILAFHPYSLPHFHLHALICINLIIPHLPSEPFPPSQSHGDLLPKPEPGNIRRIEW